MALPQVKIDATGARLSGVTLPGGATWAQEARSAALARVRQMGLPGKRDEYWKYTDPTSLNAPTAPEAALFHNDEGPLFADVDRVRIVFVDGVFDADASDDLSAEGVEIERLADAMQADIHWVKDVYGVLEARGQKPVERPLAALNTALATDGVVIRATGKVSKPINFIYLHHDVASDAVLHNVVKVDVGAEVTLLETGPAAARFSKQLEVEVAEGGVFHHVRAQGRDHERRASTHCFARIAANSSFKSFTLTFNGVLTRNECVIEIVGDEAVAHVAGACVGDGKDFHHDDTVFITHDAVNCESRQVFKKVLRNGATGVFQGKILVKEGAQKTDGYQISQSLLLDDDSQFLAKPELEIYADDVACSHGSTSGAIDETALFYLRSRGVSAKDARNLLTLSFLAEALDEIDDSALADELRDRLESWLSRHS
ncbi:SufD family Fe-S cluster assembly protein [Cognatiyoonia sp. IB215446]|uniref:SufB/SufD family protein n=1 Tax=Cognatiyoonia sp. IB215446 TaxID=3097355 RepID=UPI002A0FCF85|nr:SufD family Fe-S cluster assembly protein [Cognatiyoonia sp. IB215446]MDX8349795.1 SufD family Fe-S cluster assembly protein [Cognatiyoonia sp. IB215446]